MRSPDQSRQSLDTTLGSRTVLASNLPAKYPLYCPAIRNIKQILSFFQTCLVTVLKHLKKRNI